jgi:hypothetical protein
VTARGVRALEQAALSSPGIEGLVLRKRIGLAMRLRALGVGEGDALGDHTARTRRCGGGHKIGSAFNAQARVARQHLVAAAGFEEAGKVGELVDDDFRLRPDDGVAQGLAVEHVHDDRRQPARS